MSKYCAVVNGTMVCVPWGDDSDVPATTEERIASAIDSLKHLEKYGKNCDEDKASEAITAYVNDVCEKILECTGVFKRNPIGEAAFERFITSIGFTAGADADTLTEPYKAASKSNEATAPCPKESADTIITTVLEQPEKRKRGRPRKNPL